MRTRFGFWLACALMLLSLGLTQCAPGAIEDISEPQDEGEPIEATGPACDEARIRYMMADLQLGAETAYYRRRSNDPDVAEALRRWNAEIRIVNIQDFERKKVMPLGWKIVYAGTDQAIGGMEAELTVSVPSGCPGD